jgi:signal transduction histidine kinase
MSATPRQPKPGQQPAFCSNQNRMQEFPASTEVAARTSEASEAGSSATARLDAKLEHLDRLARLGAVSAGMAHEIKNALVATKTFVDLLLERHPDAELAPVVGREMMRINGIVQQMLQLAKPNESLLSTLDLHSTLRDTLVLVGPQLQDKSLILETELNATEPFIGGSRTRIQQVILNLLLNAAEACPQHGSIRLRTYNAVDDRGPRLFMAVSDTGQGVPPECMDRLFNPFFTTKQGGTGLGLAITRRIVEEHGAHIYLDSSPDHGACFTVDFPVRQPA